MLKVLCRNEGNKTAQSFYWHLSVPADVRGVDVQDGLRNGMLYSFSVETHDTTQYRHYTGFIDEPFFTVTKMPQFLGSNRRHEAPAMVDHEFRRRVKSYADGTMQRIRSA